MRLKLITLALLAAGSVSAHAQFLVSPEHAVASGIVVRPDTGQNAPVSIPGLPAAKTAEAPHSEPASVPEPAPVKKAAPAASKTVSRSTDARAAAPITLGALPPVPPAAPGVNSEAAATMNRLIADKFVIPSPTGPTANSGPTPAEGIAVTPGVTEVIPVSRAFMTRIATPFENPSVETSSQVEAKVKGSSLYVTVGEGPVGLFLSDKSDPDTVVSVQLVPRDIPQRDITLKLNGRSGSSVGNKEARAFEAMPYVQQLAALTNEIARGKIPAGYSMGAAQGYEISCEMPGIQLRLGQMISGTQYRIGVFVARNLTDSVLEIDEQACNDKRVAAVAAFPNNVLQPGQKTELYVITNVPPPADPTDRPALY